MRRLATLGVLLVIVSVVGHAQRPAPTALPDNGSAYLDPVNGLTLDDAIARALAQEPSLRAARSQIDVTRGLREQAGLRPNPALSFSQQQEPSGTDNQTRFEVRVQIFS